MSASETIWTGDNLPIMRGMEAGCVDLIYADPPFGTGKDWGAYVDKRTGDEYLAWIEPRLIEMRRLLKPTGSIYLHCDPTMSHYLKVLMDSVFGREQFRNEIIWCYRGGGVPRSDFARKHDVILRYSKTREVTFNVDDVRIPYSQDVLTSGASRYDKSYRTNKTYSGYRLNDKGKHPEDWWEIQPLMPSDKRERTGYPTQKPLSLLDRIILASSNPGDVVLDPFCGSGTALVAADRAGRQWIGIDASLEAIRIARERTGAPAGAALIVKREKVA